MDYDFPSIGNFMIPTDEVTPSFSIYLSIYVEYFPYIGYIGNNHPI